MGAVVSSFGFRWYRWRDVLVVVAHGDVDLDGAAKLSRALARFQRDCSVFVDLWDITSMEPVCVEVLAAAKRRADETRWCFAVIVEPSSAAAEAIEAADLQDVLRPFETKRDAEAALRA